MKNFAKLTLCLALAVTSVYAQRQDSTTRDVRSHTFEWSVAVSGAYAMHDVNFNSLPPIENCCLGFEKTESISYGGFLAVSLPVTDDGMRIGLRAGYMQLPAQFSSFSTEPVYLPGQGTVNAVFKHQLDVAFHTIPVDLLVEYPVLSSVWLGLGINGSYVASGSFKQLETLEEPGGLSFENGSKTRIDTTSSLTGYNSVIFNGVLSLRARLAHDIGSIRGIDLLAAYVHPLTSVYEPQTWQGRAGNPPRSYYIDTYRISMVTVGLAMAF